MDTKIPRRIRQFDFHASSPELEHLLGAIDSNSVSITTSIRVFVDCDYSGEYFTRFPSSPFPKLSELRVVDLLPDPSSSIFTTSNLTSLVLHHIADKPQCFRSQLLQILQQHPNLQDLVLEGSALPGPVEGSGAPVHIVLPRLVDLRLYGVGTAIAEFMDFIRMSPLHNVALHLRRIRVPTVPALSSTVNKYSQRTTNVRGWSTPARSTTLPFR